MACDRVAKTCKRNARSIPVLTYFDFSGPAEAARWCFAYGGVEFVDRRLTMEEWVAYKSRSPTGKVPTLEVDGTVLVESHAISKYAAQMAGLVPTSPLHILKAEEIFYTAIAVKDIYNPCYKEDGFEARMAMARQVTKAQYTGRCKVVEDLVAATREMYGNPTEPFAVNGKLSYVDMWIASQITEALRQCPEPSAEFAAACPTLWKIKEAVTAIPAISTFLERHHYRTNRLVLTYFDSPGRAEPIRWALRLANIPFEDNRISAAEWPAYKAANKLRHLPVLTVSGTPYHETAAILDYVSRISGMHPTCPRRQAQVGAFVDMMQGLGDAIGQIIVSQRNSSAPEGTTSTTSEAAAKQAAELETVRSETIPALLKGFERVAAESIDSEGHLVGRKLSVADLAVACAYRSLVSLQALDNPSTDYPCFAKTATMVTRIPAIVKYQLQSRARPILTYFDLAGRAECIRLCYYAAKIDFEDRRVSMADWSSTYKSVSPTGQAPYIERDGKIMVETKALLLHACMQADFMPVTPDSRVRSDMIHSAWSTRVFGPQHDVYVASDADKAAARTKMQSTILPPILKMIETMVAATQSSEGHTVDGCPTWIDFFLAGEIASLAEIECLGTDFKTEYPALNKVSEYVSKFEGVKRYREERKITLVL